MEKEYIRRINLAFDYIDKHLADTITLEEVAAAAHFSRFHFNRIFYAMVGETPFQYITRIRLERAAFHVVYHPDMPLTEIAGLCGYSDLTVFSRNFKRFFGLTPTKYRNSKISRIESNHRQKRYEIQPYFCFHNQTLKWRTNMKQNKSAEIKEFPEMTVAYVRHIGPYAGDEKLFERLWNQLFSWAGPRGLLGGKDFKSLAVYHDDPNLTDEQKLRLSVCITVPEDTKADGPVGKMKIDGGQYVVARFELQGDEFAQAWQWVYGDWLPQSGYMPDDRVAFEMYPEEPKDGKFTVDICVPVMPV